MTTLHADLMLLMPELILAVGGMAMLVFGVIRGDKSFGLLSWAAIALLLAAGYALFAAGGGTAFGGAFRSDSFGQYASALIVLGSIVAILLAGGFLREQKIARFEFPVLIVFSTVGMLIMVGAGSFIALYMGLELQSLAIYVLAAFNRDSVRSTEAGLKYFVLGALASGMLLYGISMIYGFTGTTGFATVATVIGGSGMSIGLIFGLVFLIAGLAFKVSAVPFHMWTPDVYEGAPTPVTAFLAMAPKVAAMALFLRAILTAFPDALHEWRQVIYVISILSMVLGAVAAIGQTNIKRLMAYSSIGHMGYALMGLAAGTAAGVQGVLIYLAIYVPTTAGAFGCILAMKRNGEQVETIRDLAGLSRTRPALAFALMAIMVSLSGIPPLAGFWAKFYVFLAAIDAHLYVLAVTGAVASVIGAYYYWNIFKTMYFDAPAEPFDEDIASPVSAVIAASVVFTFGFVIAGAPLIAIAASAAKALLP